MRKHLHKLKTHSHLFRVQKETVFAVVVIAIALLLLATSPHSQKPFVSSEVQFTDPSARGLAIVPASCPSTPHDDEVCDVAVSSNCSLVATNATIAPGQSTILQWQVDQPALGALFPATFSGNISPNVGSVSSWSGSTLVNPPITTTYVLNGTVAVTIPWFGGVRTGSAQCQTTVTVQDSCPAGTHTENGECVLSCPIGYIPQDDACVFNACPSGYEQQGDQCVRTAPACTPLNYCVGTTLWHRDAACSTNPVQACSNGCSAGGCIGAAPPGVVVWQVRPPLLSAGETASVSWQATSVRSCEVRGNNGDVWSGASGAQVTSPITAQTTYTLSCIGLDNSIVTQTAIVNVIPIFEEL